MSEAKTTNKPKRLPRVEIPSRQTRKKITPLNSSELEKIDEFKNEKLIFSFRFFSRNHDLFNLGDTEASWFISLIDHLKEISDLTRNELVVERRNHYDCHPHDWDKTEVVYDFDKDFLNQVECTQFRLASSKGRVHGFIVGNHFYVVWLDRHHNLYPDDKFGGVKIFPAPMTCYEKLLEEHIELLQSKQELESEFEQWMNQCDSCKENYDDLLENLKMEIDT